MKREITMNPKERYGQWLTDELFDESTRRELAAITDLDIIEIQLGEEISITDKIKYELK